ncbi:hypothetical protein PNA2_0491 [Pyrococcus sp. NA2]|uniref:DUF917 domain-containing protein n=1 Tax=Pyrococcus sp. (strain NA2) TaxID=342949 RepID=UPI000209AAC9|nr:DUF917 family protein [Pyrococcus sp. NA2]AEC51408.1 hypothetical protein PNA2_0491 [Pyrococcus sp. NA2]
MKIRVNEEIAELAVLGGAFFGGGGGGDLKLGLKHAKLAVELGDVIIVDIDSVSRDKQVVTASLVGAPASKEKYVTPSHMVRSTNLMIEIFDVEIGGIISSENGGYSTINGWIQSAVLEIPIIDAPADGRAHPTGIMGSMGLHKLKDYISMQVAVGGYKERYVEVVIRGNLERTTRVIREAAVQAGGLVAVTRNPVSPDFIKENAAIGAISKAIEVGRIIKENMSDPREMMHKLGEHLGGKVIGIGEVVDVKLETKGGFDIGRILVSGGYEIKFWNEYMTLSKNGERLAFFPDLIVTIDMKSGIPLTSAEIRKGIEIGILVVPKENLILGAGVKDPEVLKTVEEVIGGV